MLSNEVRGLMGKLFMGSYRNVIVFSGFHFSKKLKNYTIITTKLEQMNCENSQFIDKNQCHVLFQIK